MKKAKPPNKGSGVFLPVTANLGKEGRKGAATAAKSILEKLNRAQKKGQPPAAKPPKPVP